LQGLAPFRASLIATCREREIRQGNDESYKAKYKCHQVHRREELSTLATTCKTSEYHDNENGPSTLENQRASGDTMEQQ